MKGILKWCGGLALGLALPFSGLAQAGWDEALTKEEAKALLMEYLRDYSPDSYFLMQDHAQLPNRFTFDNSVMTMSKSDDYLFWISQHTPEGLREDLGTAVHETNHDYTDLKAYQLIAEQMPDTYRFGSRYSAYYINRTQQVLVEHREVVSSHVLARQIPEELRTFRYRPYLAPANPLLGAQKDGIYGLLDEWCSYMNGTRTQVDLYEYYAAHPRGAGVHYTTWIQNVAGTHFAYLEFKYFIMRYMLHLRQQEPAMYRNLLAQPTLLEAYFAIDEAFGAVVKEYYTKKAAIAEELKAKGLRVDDDGEFFSVEMSGVGTYEDEYRKLETELAKPEYQELLATLQGVRG